MAKRGLYANIHAKRKRIAAGSGEKMRKAGAKGAPTAKQFKQAAKTAKTTKKKSSRTSKKRG
jgi:signal recognition particle GTPase